MTSLYVSYDYPSLASFTVEDEFTGEKGTVVDNGFGKLFCQLCKSTKTCVHIRAVHIYTRRTIVRAATLVQH